MRQPCCRNMSQSECRFLHFCSCPPLLCTVLFSFYFFSPFFISTSLLCARATGYLSLGQFPAEGRSRRCEEEVCVFEGPVTQDVTTQPLANEGDRSTGQGQCKHAKHARVTYKKNAAAVTGVQAVACVCAVALPRVTALLRAGRGPRCFGDPGTATGREDHHPRLT